MTSTKAPDYPSRSEAAGHVVLLVNRLLLSSGRYVSNRNVSVAMLNMSFVANRVETSMVASIINSLTKALQLPFNHSSQE
jgi:hypothetical protein